MMAGSIQEMSADNCCLTPDFDSKTFDFKKPSDHVRKMSQFAQLVLFNMWLGVDG